MLIYRCLPLTAGCLKSLHLMADGTIMVDRSSSLQVCLRLHLAREHLPIALQ